MRAMAEEESLFGSALDSEIRSERRAAGRPDRAVLSDTLVKSPQWKKNTLQTIEVERSRETIADLEAENAELRLQFQDEVKALRLELTAIQGAYDQFQQESDQILEELDQQNERLRAECNTQNRRSML